MPNWATNRVEIKGEDAVLADIKKFVKKGRASFSFDKIMPMPKVIDTAACMMDEDACEQAWLYSVVKKKPLTPIAIKTIAKYCDSFKRNGYDKGFDRNPRRLDDRAESYYNALNETGCPTWYSWCIAHWGTKWDADSPRLKSAPGVLRYRFDTAWTAPLPVFVELSKKFPDVSIAVQVSYEGEYMPDAWNIKNGKAEKL